MIKLNEKDIQIVNWQVQQAEELIKQYPSKIIVLATYNELEYQEWQPSTEDYQIYITKEKLFIELCKDKKINNIVFEHVDLFGYSKYLTENNLSNSGATRSAYVAQKYKMKENK
jgi:hypothetical protein